MLETFRCITPWKVGLYQLINPVCGILGGVIAQICSKHFTSIGVKLVNSLIGAAAIVVLGYIISDPMVYVEL